MAGPSVGEVCPLCGGPMRPHLWADDRTGGPSRRIHRCAAPGCGMGVTGEAGGDTGRVTGAPAPAARTVGRDDPVRGRLALRFARRQLTPLTRRLPAGGLVMDVGAGSGVRADALTDAGMRVVAVEPDPAEAARLRAAGITTVQAGCADGAGQVRGADAAVMWHVLEHLDDPVEGLRAVRAALRPGGWLLVAVPNPAGLDAALFGGRWHGWDPARHRRHLPAPALARALTEAGFPHPRVAPCGGWGYPTSLTYSLAPALDPQTAPPAAAFAGMALAALLVPVAAACVLIGRGPQVVALAQNPLVG